MRGVLYVPPEITHNRSRSHSLHQEKPGATSTIASAVAALPPSLTTPSTHPSSVVPEKSPPTSSQSSSSPSPSQSPSVPADASKPTPAKTTIAEVHSTTLGDPNHRRSWSGSKEAPTPTTPPQPIKPNTANTNETPPSDPTHRRSSSGSKAQTSVQPSSLTPQSVDTITKPTFIQPTTNASTPTLTKTPTVTITSPSSTKPPATSNTTPLKPVNSTSPNTAGATKTNTASPSHPALNESVSPHAISQPTRPASAEHISLSTQPTWSNATKPSPSTNPSSAHPEPPPTAKNSPPNSQSTVSQFMSAPQVSNSPVMQHPVLYGPQGGLDNTNTVFKNPPQQAPMRSSTTNSQNISRARSPSPAPIPSSTPAALPSRNPSPPTQPRAPPSPSANSSVAPPITLNKHSTHSTPLTSSTTSAPKKASKRRSLSIPASAVAQSLDRDLLTKEAFKYDPEFERAAQTWIEHVTKEPLPTGVSLPAALKDGSVLCKLLNAIRPNTVRKIHVGVKLAAFHRENIQNYFIGCRTLGMNVTSLFDENDLYENKNFNIVLINIQALAALVTKLFPTLPKMDIPRPNDCLSVAFKDGTSSKSKFEVTPEQQEQLTDLTAWTNSHLVECGLSGITDVTRELQSGVELIFLLERLTGQSLGIYSAEPETAWNKMQNIALVLKFVIEQSGMHPSELCSCTDLYIGKPQAIIKLLTTLRDKFDMACTLSKLPSAQRRPYIISEVVSTEQRYVTQLQRIEEGLITPAKSCAPQMMTKEELSGIFGNIDQIMVRHAAILRQLQQGYPPGDPQALLRIDTIVEVFTGMLPWTKHAYSSYILNYDNSIAITNTLKKNTSWQALLKRFEEAYGMDISSFLVAPVQRLPRYLLLLRELVSCTPKTDPEYQILQDLWTKSQAILQAVNESKRAVDNANKLLQIAKSITGDCEPFVSRNQHFIKEGFLEIADADDDMESSYFFLLADRLILTIYNSEAKNFDYREAFMLKDIELVEERDSEEDDYSVALSMAEFEMELLATNKAQRDSWFTAIDSAVEEAKKG